MPYATLPERGLLILHGDDTLPFLQGLVSNDVLLLREYGIVYAAMLTPQGKFLHDFFIVSYGDDVLIDCNKSRLAELHKRLSMYRLRSKVTIEMMPDIFGVMAVWNATRPNIEGAFPDPRLPELGFRIYGETEKVNMPEADAADYDVHRLALGIPLGDSDLMPDKSFLLPFGFEDLRGVDFHKGCYVGQEVTARTKHLGQIRKFIYKVKSDGNTLPAAGTPVYYGEILAGELRSSHGAIGLALMSVEEVEKAQGHGKDFICNYLPVKISLPGWVKNTPGTKA